MVEHVEELAPEFHPEAFIKLRHFLKTNFPVVNARAAANCARSIADCSGYNRSLGKTIVRIESRIDRLAIHSGSRSRPGTERAHRLLRINGLEWGQYVRLAGRLEIEAGLQLDIILFGDAHGEACLKGRNPGHCPAIQHFSGKPFVLRYRQFPVVTEHKSVARVE